MDSFKEFQIIIYPSASAIKESKITVGRGFRGILERDKYVCQYCGPDGNKATTIDHVLPKSRGGGSNPGNLVAACFKCNQKKGDRTPDEAGMPLIQPVRSFRWNLMEKFHNLCDASKG
jgi:5-methylcytosine-specific restriction endonuclease McrA